MFSFLMNGSLAFRHPRSRQGASRPKPQIRGTSLGALRHLHAVWTSFPAGDTPEGSYVQEQTQIRFSLSVYGSTVRITPT